MNISRVPIIIGIASLLVFMGGVNFRIKLINVS